MISILILTKNEETALPECLASVGWSDDIHVFDSYSTDRTLEIARVTGAKVTQRHFDDWSTHQNWALRNIPFKHPWVLYVDADERVTPELATSLLAATAKSDGKVAFEIQRRDFLDGRWLRHVQASPFYLRLFRPERMRYERLVNPKSVPDGPVGRVAGYLDHYPFGKGIEHWLARHNAYSTLEAHQTAAEDASAAPVRPLAALFARDFHVRRAHQKRLFTRLPARPFLKFLALYVFKRGFLDGREGLRYAILQSFYEYMIVLKRGELSRSIRTAPVRE